MVCQKSNGVSPKLVSQIEDKVEQLREIYKNQQFKTVIMSNQTNAIFYHDPKILLSNNAIPNNSPLTIYNSSSNSNNNNNTITSSNSSGINNTITSNNTTSTTTQPITIITTVSHSNNNNTATSSPPTSITPPLKNTFKNQSPKEISATNLTAQLGMSVSQISQSQSPHSPTTHSPVFESQSIGFVVGSIEDLSQRLRQYLESVDNFVKLFAEDETQQFISQGIYHIRGCSGLMNGSSSSSLNSNANHNSSTLTCSIFVKTDITCAIFTDVYEQGALSMSEDMDKEILDIVDQLQLLLKGAIEKEKQMLKNKK
ncbi:predicted protein [Naegleria gruberi]|uniref:Predicted protein n=1 Tax=Naegleria gruberi TaxID=5762 RepID=D2VQ02_NAEGR|nr:uncharacterized protein NAEGRDRAFT_71115 [Naegleria gruberi]EFC41023.1 predicted protein [Naegleria gruberi]|eukprot:XP_002673767.1 predicted protein [Naegleria gruberi strain NEG-M]